MADGIPFHDHIDLQTNELQNASFEKLSADPTGGDLYEGRFWLNTTDNLIKVYRNSEVKVFAFLSDLVGGGAFSHDATTGIPTTGSGSSGTIKAGDTYFITVEGAISGIGGDENLDVGDLLIAIADNAASASDFIGKQRNLDDAVLTGGEVVTVNLVASTNLTITAANFTGNIIDAEVYRADGRQINVRKTLGAGSNQIILRSNQSLTGVSVRLVGLLN